MTRLQQSLGRFCLPLIVVVFSVGSGFAGTGEEPLKIATETLVREDGTVRVHLTLKNASRKPLFNVHPMLHFHHTMSNMPKIVRLEAGQGITLENVGHPPVVREGRYPLAVMVHFQDNPGAGEFRTLIHTDSFYFKEPVESEIVGEIRSDTQGEGSLLNIFLRNTSPSFKNVRILLLLPPGLTADNFQGMMGFTIRGGEEKSFQVPVRRLSGASAGSYPVHLMIEYAEMLKHYTGEIRGDVRFGLEWDFGTVLRQTGIIVLFALFLIHLYRRRSLLPLRRGGGVG